MEFFLTEVLARIVFALVAFDSARAIIGGLRTGKIRGMRAHFLSWWPVWIVERATTPRMFWFQMGIQTVFFVPSVILAITGWNVGR